MQQAYDLWHAERAQGGDRKIPTAKGSVAKGGSLQEAKRNAGRWSRY
jgi:hypothetical protein